MFTLGIIILVALLVALLVFRRIVRKKSPALLLVGALPVLATGAAEGRWPAVLGLAVVVLGSAIMLHPAPAQAK